nr:CPBP family intramembrane glutamic endopeptidase [Salinirubrum litoreum]
MGVTLAGAWWVVAVWTVAFVINVGGEELLWRGYLLPRQEAVFGRWAWLVNGLLWVVAVHAFMWWTLVGLLPTGLVTPYLVQRYESTWAGIVVHGLGNALWLGLLVVGVVGG